MPLGKFNFWQKAKQSAAAVAAPVSTTLITNPDGTASYRGWIITPDAGAGRYVAQKPGVLDVIVGSSLPVLKIQIDAAEVSGANPNAPVAVYQGWSIVRAGGAGSSYNPFSTASASGPLYAATQAGRAWPARKPKTLQETYAIIDRIVEGDTRPQDPIVEEYQGWLIRQVESDGRFYAKNPSTAQQIGGMPSLAAVRARIDQYTQPQQLAYQGGGIPYYQQGSPNLPAPYGYQQPYQQPYYQPPYGYQQPVQRDMWGNPIQNSYVPQNSANVTTPVPYASAQPQLPYQPTQANQISYYAPAQSQTVQPLPSQGAEEYGYSDAGSDDDATYTGTNGLEADWGSLARSFPATTGQEVFAPRIYNGWTIRQDWNSKLWGRNVKLWSASKTNGQRLDGVATLETLKAAIDRQNLADAGVKPEPWQGDPDRPQPAPIVYDPVHPAPMPAAYGPGSIYNGWRITGSLGWSVGAGKSQYGADKLDRSDSIPRARRTINGLLKEIDERNLRGVGIATPEGGRRWRGGRPKVKAYTITAAGLDFRVKDNVGQDYGVFPSRSIADEAIKSFKRDDERGPDAPMRFGGWFPLYRPSREYKGYQVAGFSSDLGGGMYIAKNGVEVPNFARNDDEANAFIDSIGGALPSPAPSPTPSPTPAPTPTKPSIEAPTVGGNAVRYGSWLIRAGDPTSPGHYNQQPFFASNGALMAIGQTFPDIVAKIDRAERDKPTQLDGLGEVTAHQAMGTLLVLGAVAGAIMVAHQLSRRRK